MKLLQIIMQTPYRVNGYILAMDAYAHNYVAIIAIILLCSVVIPCLHYLPLQLKLNSLGSGSHSPFPIQVVVFCPGPMSCIPGGQLKVIVAIVPSKAGSS